MNHQKIPSDYMMQAKQLRDLGFGYPHLYRASLQGGGTSPMEEPEDQAGVLPASQPYAIWVTP